MLRYLTIISNKIRQMRKTGNTMKLKIVVACIILVALISGASILLSEKSVPPTNGTNFYFVDGEDAAFTNEQRARIKEIIKATITKTKKLYPSLSENINFNIHSVDRDFSMVNGVTGRADRTHEIEISLSSTYKGGMDKAIDDGLEITLFHELHHIVRGWVVHENKFGRGIDIAAVNEGLADVFAEAQSGRAASTFPGDPDFDAWTIEILALPKNANYGEWMNQLPDGRTAVGYRTGAWLVREAMANSELNILELSELSVSEIYKLAGYSHEPSSWSVLDLLP